MIENPLRVLQVETPAQLAARNEQRAKGVAKVLPPCDRMFTSSRHLIVRLGITSRGISCPGHLCTMQETVVQRAVVAVLTRGTISDPAMMRSQPDPAWLLALSERPAESCGAECVNIGACFMDAASGQLILGEWCAPAVLLSLQIYMTQGVFA